MKRIFVLVLAVLAVNVRGPLAVAESCQRQTPPAVAGIYTCDETGDGTADRYEVRYNGTVVAVGYVAETGTPRFVAYVHTYVPDLYAGTEYVCFGGWCYLAVLAGGVGLVVWHPEDAITPINYCLNGLCGTIP